MMDRKIITAVGLLSLLVISLAAYGQTGITTATNDPKTEAVVDAAGNLPVPEAIAPPISRWEAGRLVPIRRRARRRPMSSMRRRKLSPPIARTAVFLTAPCL